MAKRWTAAPLWAGFFAIGFITFGFSTLRARADEQTVTVQLVNSMGQAPFYIAEAKGYFAAEGITVDAGKLRSALDAIGPMATGKLDGTMGAATAGFFNAAHQGFDLRIAAVSGLQGPLMATQPLARKALWDNGTIKSAKDLKGRKIAINAPGDITEYFLTRMLRKYGLGLKDVDETSMEFSMQFLGFKNGAIDAGFLPEPLATNARREGVAALIAPEANIGTGTPTTFLFLATQFMRDRPKVALGFLRALIRGARDAQGPYNKNPELAAIIAKGTGLTVEAVEDSAPYVIDPNLDIAKYENGLRQQEEVARQNGRLDYAEPLSFGKLIDARLVHEAAASLKEARASAGSH